MDELRRLRQAIRAQRYRISTHANDEMADDFLLALDIERVILTGTIAQKLTQDERGQRYVVVGDTTDERKAYVVCRLLLSGNLLIITAYAADEV